MGNSLINSVLFQPPSKCTPLPDDVPINWVETSRGDIIPTILLQPSTKKRRKINMSKRTTVIYSHANSEDLGMIYQKMQRLANELNVNILAYDYTGYGYNRKKYPTRANPSEKACYADITAVYHYLIEEFQVKPFRVVLMGRSVGTGPSCYLAEQLCQKGIEIGGVVLYSPFMSVYRVVADCGVSLSCLGDMFQNIELAEGIDKCPVYVIHGTDDEIVPFYHGCALYDAFGGSNSCYGSNYVSQNPEKCSSLWVEGMGHNSMTKHMSSQVMTNLKRFMQSVERRANDLQQNQHKVKGQWCTIDEVKYSESSERLQAGQAR